VPESEGEQRVDLRVGDQDDRSAVPSVPAVGSAPRNELLPAERDAPVAPIASDDGDACFVDEHGDALAARGPRGHSAGRMLTNRPIRPRSENFTVPLTSAKSVSSLPRPTLRPGWIGVPRCLTMIEPPETICPSNRLTPRRCEFESRPFLELPPAFL